jgi:peptidoglycan/LPS O-acetylase OafA/YrhL
LRRNGTASKNSSAQRHVTYTRLVSIAAVPNSEVVGKVPAKFGYNPGLDGLRALSVLGVIAGHGLYAVPGGYHGVTVFFVISGYLITSLLMAEYDRHGTIRFSHFYWRRFARLGPALILVTVVTAAWLVITRVPIGQWWGGLLGSLTYTTDIIATFFNNSAVSANYQFTWTLGIEEQFYLFWPLLLLLLLRRGRFVPTMVLLAVGVAATWVVRNWESTHGASRTALYYGPFSHVDALLLGCGIAMVLTRFPASKFLRIVARIVGPLGVVALAIIFFVGHFLQWIDQFGLSALAAAAVVLWVAILPKDIFGRIMSLPPLAFIGRLSYSIYLWNVLLLWVFVSIVHFHLRPAQTNWGFVWVVAVFGVAYLSYRFVENPLRRKWAPPQAHAVMDKRGENPAAEAPHHESQHTGSQHTAGQHAEGSRQEAPPASTLAESADGTATKDAPAT